MNPNFGTKFLAATLALVFCFTNQAPAGIAEDLNKAVQTMENGNWEEAERLLKKLIVDFKDQAFATYGPAFGVVFYNLGYCQIQLQKFGDAAKNFEICYKEYPNIEGETEKVNRYRIQSLYLWGLAEQAQEQYEGAIKIYEKFISEKPDQAEYSVFSLYTNMGICKAKVGKMDEGVKLISQVFERFDRLNPSEKRDIFKAFIILTEKWIELNQPAEAIKFMNVNEYALRYSAIDTRRNGFDQQLLRLAKVAAEQDNLQALTLKLTSFIPRTEDILHELDEMLLVKQSDRREAELRKQIEQIEADVAAGKVIDLSVFQILANVFQKLGNFRGSYAIYDYMSRHYPTAVDGEGKPLHPRILYAAAHSAFVIGDLQSAQYHALLFLRDYPEHELKEKVQGLLLEHLFALGEYERCLEITESLLPNLTEGSPEHDMALYIRGGSLFYDAQFPEARKELDKHIETYPKSTYKEQVTYYHASTGMKLAETDAQYAAVGISLDGWLKEFGESALRPFALLDRATVYFFREEAQNEKALAQVAEIESKHAESVILDSAVKLKGDIQSALEQYPEAEASYKEALALSKQKGNDGVAVDAILQLINLTAAAAAKEERPWQDAEAYFNEYITNYEGNPREPNVVASSLETLGKVGRADEGVSRMEDMIIRLGNAQSADLEKAVNTYGSFYSDFQGADKLIERLKWHHTQDQYPDRVRAWFLALRVSTIQEEFEEGPKKNAEIKVTMNALQDFDKSDLAPYLLYSIGRFMIEGGELPAAEPWFAEIVNRGEAAGEATKGYAYWGLAKIGMAKAVEQGNEGGMKEAVSYFEKLKNVGDRNQQEEILADIARSYGGLELWGDAEKYWEEYTQNKSFNRFNAEAWYALGYAREMGAKRDLEKLAEASVAYSRCYTKYMQYIRFSAPAWRRTAEIQWSRNERENAYTIIKLMVKRMWKFQGHEEDPDDNIGTAIKLYEQWKAELGMDEADVRGEGEEA
ncbi:MAG: tetratricopeptide repeat protein [Verrucomicrobiota bacterium]